MAARSSQEMVSYYLKQYSKNMKYFRSLSIVELKDAVKHFE